MRLDFVLEGDTRLPGRILVLACDDERKVTVLFTGNGSSTNKYVMPLELAEMTYSADNERRAALPFERGK